MTSTGSFLRKLAQAVLASLVFLATLVILYVVAMRYLAIDVVFYASIQVAAVSVVVAAAFVLATGIARFLNRFELAQLLLIWVLSGYVLAISVPTVLDRSLSFYILEKLQQRGGGIRLDRFNYIFTTEYMREHRLVEIRLTEQQESGTLKIEDGCVKLTPRGERLATFGQFFRKNLLPKRRLLSGEYTDVLTDPFRRSDQVPDYLCK